MNTQPGREPRRAGRIFLYLPFCGMLGSICGSLLSPWRVTPIPTHPVEALTLLLLWIVTGAFVCIMSGYLFRLVVHLFKDHSSARKSTLAISFRVAFIIAYRFPWQVFQMS
jgi:hypothetical protein